MQLKHAATGKAAQQVTSEDGERTEPRHGLQINKEGGRLEEEAFQRRVRTDTPDG